VYTTKSPPRTLLVLLISCCLEYIIAREFKKYYPTNTNKY